MASAVYPNDLVTGCKFGPDSPYAWSDKGLPRWLRRGAAPLTVGAHRRGKLGARDLLKALAIAICTALLGLALSRRQPGLESPSGRQLVRQSDRQLAVE